MHDNWKHIIDFGPRTLGSKQLESCSQYLLKEMSKVSDIAFRAEYDTESWSVVDWNLEIIGSKKRKLKSYLFLGSGASEYFEGKIIFAGHNRVWNMYVWERYAVVDKENQIQAYITVRENGDAIPQMLFMGESELPHFIVGCEEIEFFRNAIKHDTYVSGCADTSKNKNAKCYNVVGSLGEDNRKIVICAHYDTVYNTPGAYDNSSGAAVVLEIARRINASFELNRTIEFLLTDGEEYNLVGSRKRVKQCLDNNENIEMAFCVDGVGRENEMEVWSGPEPFERKIRNILEKSEETFTTLYKCPPPPGSDHEAYYHEGIPSCMLTFNDQGILHSPEDVYEESKLKNMYVMVNTMISILEEMDIVSRK